MKKKFCKNLTKNGYKKERNVQTDINRALESREKDKTKGNNDVNFVSKLAFLSSVSGTYIYVRQLFGNDCYVKLDYCLHLLAQWGEHPPSDTEI